MFSPEAYASEIITWIKNYFAETKGKTAVIGISGGKDSAVCAALCKEALGKDNVLGVLMPNGEQADIQDSIDVCEHLGIRYRTCNIAEVYKAIVEQASIDPFGNVAGEPLQPSQRTLINIAPRLRMTLLYAIAQSEDEGRVCCCSNLLEALLGWGTLWGDTVGDFAPLRNFTVSQVVAMGLALELPRRIVCKTPADGLTGKSDEENLGLRYDDVEHFIGDEASEMPYSMVERIAGSAFKRDLLAGIPAPKGASEGVP